MALGMLLLSAIAVFAQPDFKEIESHLSERVAAGEAVGIHLAYIAPNGDVSHLSKGQLAKGSKQEVDRNTIFEIGSITKVFTTLALADLLQKTGINLDDRAEPLLPEGLELPTYEEKAITVQNLVTHRSGLPRIPDNLDTRNPNPYAHYTDSMLTSFLSHYELKKKPGSEFAYSNLGMALVGLILEEQTGQSFEEIAEQRITNPLGMSSTSITIADNDSSRFAKGYNGETNVSYWDFDNFAAAGALRSTGADMVRFLKAQMGNRDTKLYPQMKQTQAILARASNENQDVSHIGMGWLYSTQNDTIVWHNGGTAGFSSFMGFNKQKGSGVIVLSNTANNVNDLGFHLLDTDYPLKDIRKTISLTEQDLVKYVGEYEVTDNTSYFVSHEGNQLYFRVSGQQKVPFYPESETRFFCKVIPAEIVFDEGKNGRMETVTLYQNGQQIKAQRVSKKQ